MKTITFEDRGQDFTEWVIHNGIVIDCQPFQARVWVGKEVRVEGNKAYIRVGDSAVPINYRVVSIEDTDEAYFQGFNDANSGKKDGSLYESNKQYRYGFNVAMSLTAKQSLLQQA